MLGLGTAAQTAASALMFGLPFLLPVAAPGRRPVARPGRSPGRRALGRARPHPHRLGRPRRPVRRAGGAHHRPPAHRWHRAGERRGTRTRSPRSHVRSHRRDRRLGQRRQRAPGDGLVRRAPARRRHGGPADGPAPRRRRSGARDAAGWPSATASDPPWPHRLSPAWWWRSMIGLLARDPGAERTTADPSAGPPVSPYRHRPTLWRVHAASSLLVVPQFATATFAAEYLVSGRSWDGSDAGRVLAVVGAGRGARPPRRRALVRRRGQPAAPDASGRGPVSGLHGAAGPRGPHRFLAGARWRSRWRPSSRSRTTAWASPPPPSWPGAPGRVGRWACRTPPRTSPPSPPARSSAPSPACAGSPSRSVPARCPAARRLGHPGPRRAPGRRPGRREGVEGVNWRRWG